MTSSRPVLNQLNLVVRDMDATIDFYRRLGVEADGDPNGYHVGVRLPNGLLLDFDTHEFAAQWDSAWTEETASPVVIGFRLASRGAVDETYDALTGAGHRAHQPPYDAFWGARYAIVEDPDGNSIGLMSPIDDARKSWPPTAPPIAPPATPGAETGR